MVVSTHSRSKAAAYQRQRAGHGQQGFNSQPLEGGCAAWAARRKGSHGFNSQPLEGGCPALLGVPTRARGFNSQPLEGGCVSGYRINKPNHRFQLTAARRRLPGIPSAVATSSERFNSQPLEGGCAPFGISPLPRLSFNSQPLEGGC